MKKLKSIYSIIILLVLIAFTVGAIFITDRSTASESSIVTTDFIAVTTTVNENSDGIIDTSDLFTDRDLTQNADLNGAIYHTVSDGQDFTIHADGVYVISGTASNASIIINAPSTAKIQLVLDDLHITNDSSAAIIVREAKKVFVTTASDSSLSVSGDFEAYDGINVDAVIFSKADLILNGTAVLTIDSGSNGITGKDDLKITGGTYYINAGGKAIEANDSIRIADGTINIVSEDDGLHADNDDDPALGYIYICGGEINIQSGDDAIHANSVIQIDDGTISVSAPEGIEATYIQINGGSVFVVSTDDGINANQSSSAYRTAIEINGGNISVNMGSGDTDGLDSNGDIYVNGGTIEVTGQSAFDYDGYAEYNGGTIIVNGQEIDYIPNQMMGGGMGGSRGGR